MLTVFRFYLLFIVFSFGLANLIAQTVIRDAVFLKNGSIIKGVMMEMIPGKSIKILTRDGSLFVYALSEIEKIEKDTIQRSEPGIFSNWGEQNLPSCLRIFGGITMPIGDFGKTTVDANTSSPKGGFAKTGFVAGVQYVSNSSIGILINASYARNSTSSNDLKSTFNNPADEWLNGLDNIEKEISMEDWSSILLLAGMKIEIPNSLGLNFFFAPLIGINILKSPGLAYNASGGGSAYFSTSGIYTLPDGTTKYISSGFYPFSARYEVRFPSIYSTVFAYGATAELLIGGHFTFGFRFITCSPKFEGEMSFNDLISLPIINYNYSDPTKEQINYEPNISIIQIYAGFAF